MSDIVKGYKVFNPDWTCRGFQYEVGGKYEMTDPIALCHAGFHFCKKAADCFNYYGFNSDNKVAEVIAYGDVIDDGRDKFCTNKIEIVREIGWHEVLDLVNTGNNCTGIHNSGSYNSGDHNSGDHNSGEWNKTSFSNGCFNTIVPKIYLFNKPSEWTYSDWLHSDAKGLLDDVNMCNLEYVYWDDMTDEEKASHPETETTGGYLKKLTMEDNVYNWWMTLDDDDRDIIKNIPNFDPEIFKEITGIDVNED